MKINLLAFVLVTSFLMQCGCSDRSPSPSELAVRNVRRTIQVLSTNASVKAIRATDGVRQNLSDIREKDRRIALIGEWERALMGVGDAAVSSEDRYCAIRDASNLLNFSVAMAMRDAGCDYAEVWELHFRALKWLDGQVLAMRPDVVPVTESNYRELNSKWACYQAMAEWRETVVENHERFDFDERLWGPDMKRMAEVRSRFEKMTGRPIRSRSEIRRLGEYLKVVRARIVKERETALSGNNAISQGGPR